MKNKLFLAFYSVCIIAILSSSCSKSPVANPNQAFIGNYIGTATVVANGNSSTGGDTLIITAGVNSSAILLTDNGTQLSVGATVSGNTFTVSSQTINVNGVSVTLSGGGTLNGNTITGSYTGTSGTTPFSASYTDVK